METRSAPVAWLDVLGEEEIELVKRFVLASGSLKDLGASYGVSYPTARLRLDRVIAKIQVVDGLASHDPFERAVRAEYAAGKLDGITMKTLLTAHRRSVATRERSSGE